MCLVIGAGQLGKYAGFSCYPEAQAEAFEDLMQQHDPAGWQAALARQSQFTEAQKAQRTIQKLPEPVQARYQSAMQLTGGRFEHMPHAKQQCSTAHQSLESDLLRLRNTKDGSQSGESACALGQSDDSSAEAPAGSTATTTTLETDSADSEEVAASYLAPPEAASSVTDEAASHIAPSQAASTASDDAASQLAALETASTTSDDPASQLAASEATCTASDMSLSTVNTDTEDEEVTSDSVSGSSPSQSGASYTQADIDQVLSYLTQQKNTAYGIPAERDAIRELDSEAGLAQNDGWEWHKMGAPDNVHIGTYYGIEFELGCQVDRALVKNQRAFPAEIKNRMHHFRNQLPEQELVQVQCQLQLCEASQGVLIERLETEGVAQARWHKIRRDDQYWNTRVMPHLHAFVQVFASMATESGGLQLSTYFDARREGRHHSFLQKLVLQQLSPSPEVLQS